MEVWIFRCQKFAKMITNAQILCMSLEAVFRNHGCGFAVRANKSDQSTTLYSSVGNIKHLDIWKAVIHGTHIVG